MFGSKIDIAATEQMQHGDERSGGNDYSGDKCKVIFQTRSM